MLLNTLEKTENKNFYNVFKYLLFVRKKCDKWVF